MAKSPHRRVMQNDEWMLTVTVVSLACALAWRAAAVYVVATTP